MQHLETYLINNQVISICVFFDTETEYMNPVLKVWEEVYIDEMELLNNSSVHAPSRYLPTGAIVFAAFIEDKCIGSIRAMHSTWGPPEFPVEHYPVTSNYFEVSKFMVSKNYRNTNLPKILMMHTHLFGISNYKYENIIINAQTNSMSYYKRIGFEKLSHLELTHPILQNKCFLMNCESDQFLGYVLNIKSQIQNNVYIRCRQLHSGASWRDD
jgi:GNAT superfamily N-acetyltransferase